VNVLFAAAECAPYVKVGGLGDVVGALPGALRRLGHSVRVALPHYGIVDDSLSAIEPYVTFSMPWNDTETTVEVARAVNEGVPHYFIRGWPFFSEEERFIYSHDEGIDVGRFLFFSAALLELVKHLHDVEGWSPDVYHAHDWHTAMLPYLVVRLHPDDPARAAPTVFSIHNMRYQGWGLGWHLARAGLPPVEHPLLHAVGRADNALAVGLAHSTLLTTVSPRYAQEIMTGEAGFGLDGILHARIARLAGILNGIDVEQWNPATSDVIPRRFDAHTLEERAANKLALQAELGLPQDADVPLVAAVMRLVDQKGPQILIPAMRHMLGTTDVQFVLLGTGQYHYENDARLLGYDFPEKVAVRLMFSEPLSERIYAGADVFVMPSLFEPCGLGQMLAMRYGAIPVVRNTGGLADTVTPDTGFLFGNFSAGALRWAVEQALGVYRGDPAAWRRRQAAAMSCDFSWANSAARYEDVYRRAVELRRRYA
jgi:starch synthase